MASWLRNLGWKKLLPAAVASSALAALGGPYVYFHFVAGEAPPPLAVATPADAGTAASGSDTDQSASAQGSDPGAAVAADGTWRVASGSVVGYRVREILLGQSNEAVGRTSSVTGSITVQGTTVTAAGFSVDMATVRSDESRRDGQFNGRIMQTSTYPKATFKLTAPIELGSIPASGTQRTVKARGELTLPGVTRTVEIELTGQYGSTLRVTGSIPITFADWGIPNPSFGPAQTEDRGLIEFALVFARA